MSSVMFFLRYWIHLLALLSAYKPEVWKSRFLRKAGETWRGLLCYSLQRKKQVSVLVHVDSSPVPTHTLHSCRWWIWHLIKLNRAWLRWAAIAVTESSFMFCSAIPAHSIEIVSFIRMGRFYSLIQPRRTFRLILTVTMLFCVEAFWLVSFIRL